MEDIVICLGLEVFNLDYFYLFPCSRNTQVTFLARAQSEIIIFKIGNIDI